MYLCISVCQQQKSLNHEISHDKTNWTREIPSRNYFGPTKHPREKLLDLRNTHEKKCSTHEVPNFCTHEVPTRKNFGPTKYPWRHDSIMAPRPTGPTTPHDSLNLAHSLLYSYNSIVDRLWIMLMSTVIWCQILLIMKTRLPNIFWSIIAMSVADLSKVYEEYKY